MYKENKAKIDVTICKVKLKAFKDLFDKLNSKEGEKDRSIYIYRMESGGKQKLMM